MTELPDNTLSSASGIISSPKTGESVIPSSVRADGSVRKEIKIKPGYIPPEDVNKYTPPRRRAVLPPWMDSEAQADEDELVASTKSLSVSDKAVPTTIPDHHSSQESTGTINTLSKVTDDVDFDAPQSFSFFDEDEEIEIDHTIHGTPQSIKPQEQKPAPESPKVKEPKQVAPESPKVKESKPAAPTTPSQNKTTRVRHDFKIGVNDSSLNGIKPGKITESSFDKEEFGKLPSLASSRWASEEPSTPPPPVRNNKPDTVPSWKQHISSAQDTSWGREKYKSMGQSRWSSGGGGRNSKGHSWNSRRGKNNPTNQRDASSEDQIAAGAGEKSTPEV